jgi:hypothetical protein
MRCICGICAFTTAAAAQHRVGDTMKKSRFAKMRSESLTACNKDAVWFCHSGGKHELVNAVERDIDLV